MRKLFGTDGIRGVANLDPMTSEMAMQLGRAAAHIFMRRAGRHQIVIGISIGIALAPQHGVDPDQLLKNADLALYRTKSEGRNGYRFFEVEMDAEARLRRSLELDLRNALSRSDFLESNDFVLHYQPVHAVSDRRVCGFEALIRWKRSGSARSGSISVTTTRQP